MTAAGADNEQELRLALAMRGGTSMAVWIGGAVAEIEHLRTAMAGNDDARATHPWAALARLAGFDSVTVDVIAGASAGGVNATLLSAALIYDRPFERTRRMWVRLADVEALARPLPRFWQQAPPSLLEGDGYFRDEMVKVLTDTPGREDAEAPSRAELLLTATLLDPVVEQHFDGRTGSMLQERRRAWFRFRHLGRAGDPMSDFGAGEDLPDTALKLAHAARATSSFPFVFEPAQVHAREQAPPPDEPAMLGLFSESGDGPYGVIDGGLLDNIPVEAAVRAIAEAPADRPTCRWLLYLNPDPAVAQGRPPEAARAVPVAAAALQTKMAQESLLEDIRALDAHNRVVERNSLRRKALFAPLHAAPETERPALLDRLVDMVEADHAVVRAELDALAVHRLLTEPAGIEAGTLLPPPVGDPLAGWSAQAREQLPERLSAGLSAAATGEVFDDVRGLLAGIQLCLEWAWDLDRRAADTAEIGRCKAVLYRLRTFGELLEGHTDRYWISGAVLEPLVQVAELDDWVRRVLARRHRLQHALPSPIDPLLGEVLTAVEQGTDLQQALVEFARELRSTVDSSGADAAPGAEGVDAVARGTEVLHRVADRLAAVAPPRTEATEPEQLGFALLERSGRRAEVVRELVVLSAPLDVCREPGSRINFLRVASDEQSPLPFDALRRSPDAPLRIRDKIRGVELNNFGAFLSAKWRANDWMWGRMDAAASLVGLLTDPVRLTRRHGGSEALGDALQAIVSRPTTAELGDLDERESARWREFLAGLWARHAAEVRAELDALFAAPDDRHGLPRTRALLTERLQWTIAAEEIPFVATVPVGADPEDGARPPVPEPERLEAEVRRYDVGRQRLPDLGERRRLSVVTRLGLLAYRAARPAGRGALPWLGRRFMTLLKPLLLLIGYAVAAPRRTAAVAFLGAAAMAFTGFEEPREPHLPDQEISAAPLWGENAPTTTRQDCGGGTEDGYVLCWTTAVKVVDPLAWTTILDFGGASAGFSALVGGLLAVVFACWLGWRVGGAFGRGRARIAPALAVVVGLLGLLFWGLTYEVRLGPLGLALVAAALTWPAAVVYRTPVRVVAVLITLVSFIVTLWLGGPLVAIGGNWITFAIVVTAYAHMVLLGTVDVLAPRPRPRGVTTA
ncbi:patatin-like protein [Saccharopolyspora cebuensis]|uniref:Patatin-like protein n=1 Tax=Saccharopolyspora cebuensis TaxID=418759 RepID=A0ABV4CNQ3_9PSEU